MRLFIIVERVGGPSLNAQKDPRGSRFVAKVYGTVPRGDEQFNAVLCEDESTNDAKEAVSKALGQLAYFIDREQE